MRSLRRKRRSLRTPALLISLIALCGVLVVIFSVTGHSAISITDITDISITDINNQPRAPDSRQVSAPSIDAYIVTPERISLIDLLVGSNSTTKCPPPLVYIHDKVLPRALTHADRLISKQLHLTSKTRCLTPELASNVEQWRSFDGHSLYFHDDVAVNRLLQAAPFHADFPLLQTVQSCATSGATRADLWRYLVLWEYGGIYADIDSLPRKFNSQTIGPKTDAFFLNEKGQLSQFFLASSKRHPLLKHVLNWALERLSIIPNVMINNPVQTTGPQAVRNGFIAFMNSSETDGAGLKKGVYRGTYNRSLILLGKKDRPREYVNPDVFSLADKNVLYVQNNLTHHLSFRKLPKEGRISCLEHIERTNGSRIANYRYSSDAKKYVEAVD